jgi:hypothetical protein
VTRDGRAVSTPEEETVFRLLGMQLAGYAAGEHAVHGTASIQALRSATPTVAGGRIGELDARQTVEQLRHWSVGADEGEVLVVRGDAFNVAEAGVL